MKAPKVSAANLQSALKQILPARARSHAPKLARALAEAFEGGGASGAVASEPGLDKALASLDGNVVLLGRTLFAFERSRAGVKVRVGSVKGDVLPDGDSPRVLTPGRRRGVTVKGSRNIAADKIIDSVVFQGDVTLVVEQPLPIYPSPGEVEDGLRLLETMPVDELPRVSFPTFGSQVKYERNRFFVGREADLLRLARRLKGGGPEAAAETLSAAVTGFVGIGKTQLAVEFVYRFGRYFAGGVFWLDFSDPSAVPAQVAACGGVGALNFGRDFHALPLREQVAAVRAAWQTPMPRLLVFDNCESDELVQDWRPRQSGCRVIVTSRRDDWLSHLGLQPLPLDVLSAAESVELLKKYDDRLDPSDPAVKEIVERLGGLPLALHLAGCYMEVTGADLGPADYAALLRAPPTARQLSTQRRVSSPTRHDSDLARAFDLCYQLLDTANDTDSLALSLLERAAHFAAGNFIPRCLLVNSLRPEEKTGPARRRVPFAVKRLRRVGLLEQQQAGDLRMHRLLVEFVNHATDAGREAEAQTAVERLFFRAVMWPEAAGYRVSMRPIQPHLYAVFNEAFRRSFAEGDFDFAAQKLLLISKPTLSWGGYQGSVELFESVADKIEDPVKRMRVLQYLGLAYSSLGQQAKVCEYLGRALGLARSAGAPADEAVILNQLGNYLFDIGRVREALEHYGRALALARHFREGERTREAKLRINKGRCHYSLGETGAAVAENEAALDFLPRLETPELACEIRYLYHLNQGACEYVRGRVRAAVRHSLAALRAAREAGGEREEIACLNNLADYFTALGKYARARGCLKRGLEKCRALTWRSMEGHLLHTRAELLTDTEEFSEAVGAARAGAAVGRSTENPQVVSDNGAALARAHLLLGDLSSARDAIADAGSAFDLDSHYYSALAGLVEMLSGNVAGARKKFGQGRRRAAALVRLDAKNFAAHFTAGLALCGLFVLGDSRQFKAARAAYDRALALNSAAGSVRRELRLLQLLTPLDAEGRLAEVRSALESSLRLR